MNSLDRGCPEEKKEAVFLTPCRHAFNAVYHSIEYPNSKGWTPVAVPVEHVQSLMLSLLGFDLGSSSGVPRPTHLEYKVESARLEAETEKSW